MVNHIESGSNQKNMILTTRRDYKGDAHFELLPNNQTINLDVYIHQQMKLEEAIKKSNKKWRNLQIVKLLFR